MIAVNYERRPVDGLAGLEQEVPAVELFFLDMVGDWVAAIGRAEMRLNTLAFVANDVELVDTCVDEYMKTCSRICRLATGSIDLGRFWVRGRSRMPSPPARMMAEERTIVNLLDPKYMTLMDRHSASRLCYEWSTVLQREINSHEHRL